MISILIPTYNFNAYPLVQKIEQQALSTGIRFEIICIDDGSFSPLNLENQKINTLTNCKFIEKRQNKGSAGIRQHLAEKAQYNWLLFLDADVMPKNNNFITNYINVINTQIEAIFGGFAYKPCIDKNKSLRCNFGKKREEIDAVDRNKNPYKVIISANYLIKKEVFLKCNTFINKNLYGLDYLLGSKLKQNKISVKHINNEVYHLGIDDNNVYLEKVKKAVETLAIIYKNKLINRNDISLLKAYKWLKLFGLSSLFGKLMYRFNISVEIQILKSTPNLFLFDLYRLGYFCRIQQNI